MAFDKFLDTDLFSNLTNEERLVVQRYSAKRDSDLPKFFNAGRQSVGEEPDETISREFEAFLILQAVKSPDKLSNAMKWFTDAASLQVKRKDRDELLEEAFGNEREDALRVLQDVQTSTLRFAQFRETFEIVDVGQSDDSIDYPASRFTDVPELSLLLRDSQAALGEVASKLSRSEHLVVVDAVLDEERKNRELSQESIGSIPNEKIAAELLSWRSVIAEIQARVQGNNV